MCRSVVDPWQFGTGSAYPYHWFSDPDPGSSVADKKMTRCQLNFFFQSFFCWFLFEGTFFKGKKYLRSGRNESWIHHPWSWSVIYFFIAGPLGPAPVPAPWASTTRTRPTTGRAWCRTCSSSTCSSSICSSSMPWWILSNIRYRSYRLQLAGDLCLKISVADPYLWLTDPDPDPGTFVGDLQDDN